MPSEPLNLGTSLAVMRKQVRDPPAEGLVLVLDRGRSYRGALPRYWLSPTIWGSLEAILKVYSPHEIHSVVPLNSQSGDGL